MLLSESPLWRKDNLLRWNRTSISVGGMVWLLIACVRWLSGWNELNELELLLLLALCVITPLAVPLVAFPRESHLLDNLFTLIIFVQPFATLIGGVSLLLGMGPLAATMASVWLLFTVLLAISGLLRLFQKDRPPLTDICLAVALIYVPIGSIWFVLSRLGLRPLGFDPVTILLTAVHFHFITLAALIITGLVGRAMQTTQRGLRWKIYRITAWIMLIDPLVVAAGITTTQLTGQHSIESTAAVLLALSLFLITLLSLCYVIPTTLSRLAKGLLTFSSLAVLLTMLFAIAYALGAATGMWTITIAQMIVIHGWMNALAFGFCGLLGWRLRIGRKAN